MRTQELFAVPAKRLVQRLQSASSRKVFEHYFKRVAMMRIGNTYGLENQQIVTGLFRNSTEVYQAQEILTDFGYAKEASNRIELKARPRKAKAYGKPVFLQTKDKVIFGITIGATLILGALLTGGHFYSTMNFSEIGILLTVWASLMALSAVICGFIGILVAILISSSLAGEVMAVPMGNAENVDVLISVAIKTPNDAQDIAREWIQIGREVA